MNRFWPLFLVLSSGLALLTRPTQAQYIRDDARRPSFHLGVTTGLGTSWLVDNRLLEDPNYRYVQTYRRAPIGFTVGAHFNDHNGVQIEAVQVQQGADHQIISPSDNDRRVGTKNIRLTYWSVPILFKYTAGVDRRTRFEFHLGPQINFLSDGSEVNHYDQDAVLQVTKGKTDLVANVPGSTKAHKVTAGTSETMATKADYRAQTIGAAFGMGLEFKIYGPLYLSTLVRGTYAFSEVRSDATIQRVKDAGYYSPRQSAIIGVQVGLHYQFISPAEGHPKDRGY